LQAVYNHLLIDGYAKSVLTENNTDKTNYKNSYLRQSKQARVHMIFFGGYCEINKPYHLSSFLKLKILPFSVCLSEVKFTHIIPDIPQKHAIGCSHYNYRHTLQLSKVPR